MKVQYHAIIGVCVLTDTDGRTHLLLPDVFRGAWLNVFSRRYTVVIITVASHRPVITAVSSVVVSAARFLSAFVYIQ